MLFYELYYVLVYVLCLGSYFIIQIGTIERAFEIGGICYTEIPFYIGSNLVCCRCREGYNRCTTYPFYYITQVAVFRSEVMSPFRYAVCFVYGIKRNLCFFERFSFH